MSAIAFKVNQIVNFLNKPENRIDGATAYLCDGFFHAFEILRNQPGTPKIAVGFSKAVARVNFPGGDITGRENQFFYGIVSRGRGLAQDRAANVYTGTEGGKPLIEDAELLRDALSAFRFDPQTDEQPDYIGIDEWGQPQGFNLDAFKVSIWVGTQRPIDSTIPLNAMPI